MPSLTRLAILLFVTSLTLHGTSSITSNGVTWAFAGDHVSGLFVSGDPWVVGPVNIVSITNTLNSPKFTPKPGQNGSMLNPVPGSKQGYDSGLLNYDASLNSALIDGQALSKENPLNLAPGSTLVSAVSWLFNNAKDREPGSPRFNGVTGTPRPAVRSAGVLTVLAMPPPPGAFRPPYSGADKTIRFLASQIDFTKIPHLKSPTASVPNLAKTADILARPWIDHANGWLGAYIHPSEHMPDYGRDLAREIVGGTLGLFVTPEPREKNPDFQRTVIGLMQLGIDLAGIADAGGNWPADGGHGLGRKWPILFTGALLNDRHLLDVGHWQTVFQEDAQTFYVTQETVDLSNSPKWAPDKRGQPTPYTAAHIGIAEWGIRHTSRPQADNASWFATYRDVNACVYPGFALAARIMGLQSAWNHDAFFDYSDRYMEWMKTEKAMPNRPSEFLIAMWSAYPAKTH